MGRAGPLLLIVIALIVFFISERVNVLAPISGRDTTTVVSFWAFATPAQTMRELKSEFEDQFPHIRVEVQTVPWESLQQKTLWAIAAQSNVPDVIVGSSEWTGGLASAGGLEPLDKHLGPEFFARYFPATLGTYQFPEVRRDKPGWRGPMRQYGIPLDLDMMLVFYRADLLEPAMRNLGMDRFPETWSEFRRLGQALRDSQTPQASGVRLLYLDPEDPVPMSMAFLPSSGGRFLDQTMRRAVFDEPESAAAFEFFADLLRSDIAIRWSRSTMEDPIVLYKTGRAAANISGPWYAKLLATKAPELAGRWRVALFPRREPGLPPCGLGGACLAVPYNAPNKEAAMELIRYMATDRFALNYFRRVGSPPPMVSAWSDPVFQQRDPYFGGQCIYDVVRQAIEQAKPLPLMPNTEITKGAVRTAMREISVNGEMTSVALKRAVLRANRILAEE
ncbi:MAG: extracellular solute-binding protein [Candidatus Sumerlaeaceae bacterium]|nr:extracellular solute-binding protein [Candidatus Sumerlaeaceae bacterium]